MVGQRRHRALGVFLGLLVGLLGPTGEGMAGIACTGTSQVSACEGGTVAQDSSYYTVFARMPGVALTYESAKGVWTDPDGRTGDWSMSEVRAGVDAPPAIAEAGVSQERETQKGPDGSHEVVAKRTVVEGGVVVRGEEWLPLGAYAKEEKGGGPCKLSGAAAGGSDEEPPVAPESCPSPDVESHPCTGSLRFALGSQGTQFTLRSLPPNEVTIPGTVLLSTWNRLAVTLEVASADGTVRTFRVEIFAAGGCDGRVEIWEGDALLEGWPASIHSRDSTYQNPEASTDMGEYYVSVSSDGGDFRYIEHGLGISIRTGDPDSPELHDGSVRRLMRFQGSWYEVDAPPE